MVLCGGIGAGAQASLAQAGIQLFGGISGSADAAAADYLAGRLVFDPQRPLQSSCPRSRARLRLPFLPRGQRRLCRELPLTQRVKKVPRPERKIEMQHSFVSSFLIVEENQKSEPSPLSRKGSDFYYSVRITGLEPARRRHWTLKPARLPIPPYPLKIPLYFSRYHAFCQCRQTGHIRAIPHNSKCRYGERGAADAKPKAQIILDVLSSILATQMPCRSRRSGA